MTQIRNSRPGTWRARLCQWSVSSVSCSPEFIIRNSKFVILRSYSPGLRCAESIMNYELQITNALQGFFCGPLNTGDNPAELVSLGMDRIELQLSKISGVLQKTQPVGCLTGFLVCNGHFREKIRLGLRTDRFLDVGANACAGTQKLFRQHKLLLLLSEELIQTNNAHRKRVTLCMNKIIFHARSSDSARQTLPTICFIRSLFSWIRNS